MPYPIRSGKDSKGEKNQSFKRIILKKEKRNLFRLYYEQGAAQGVAKPIPLM